MITQTEFEKLPKCCSVLYYIFNTQKDTRMKTDPKPNLSRAGIESNICYYESLVSKSKDDWEQHLQHLQHWIDELAKLKEVINE